MYLLEPVVPRLLARFLYSPCTFVVAINAMDSHYTIQTQSVSILNMLHGQDVERWNLTRRMVVSDCRSRTRRIRQL